MAKLTNFNVLLENTFLEYLNTKVIFTSHSVQRQIEREISNEDLKVLCIRAIEEIKNYPKKYSYAGSEFLFFSKELNQGMIIDYRRDRENPKDERKHLIVVTVLPKGKKQEKPGTNKVVVENYVVNDLSDIFLEYFNEVIIPNDFSLIEDIYEVSVENLNYNLKATFVDNKFYNLINAEIVELD